MVDPSASGTIDSLAQMEAVSSPVRVRILRLARRPITVGELAEALGVPKTRLYYHVNLLVDAGFLAQVDERKSGARLEKIYLRTAGQIELRPGLTDELGNAKQAATAATAVLLDPARVEIEDFLESVFSGREPTGQLGRTVVRLMPDDIDRFTARAEELVEEIRRADAGDAAEAVAYSFTGALIPTGETV